MQTYPVEELAERPGEEMVELMSAAYLSTPLVQAAFPGGEEARRQGNRSLFRLSLSGMLQGTWLVVREGKTVVGALHYASWPLCRPPAEARPSLAGMMTSALGTVGARVAEWFGTWAELDPPEPHWHLGPLGVHPDRQGQGLGRELMREYCRRLDAAGAEGYLETDVPRNVPFYEKSGFCVTHETQVIGVQNWFMRRR